MSYIFDMKLKDQISTTLILYGEGAEMENIGNLDSPRVTFAVIESNF